MPAAVFVETAAQHLSRFRPVLKCHRRSLLSDVGLFNTGTGEPTPTRPEAQRAGREYQVAASSFVRLADSPAASLNVNQATALPRAPNAMATCQ